ncbi:MAG: acetoacetate decarboxylase family protein [Microthrixaceae bacterium]|nr:acetoacetate decarboxylase family protein [Microthrixaceae bacterium]
MTSPEPAASTQPLGGLAAAEDGTYEVEGRAIHMPVRVRSARMASAMFLVDGDSAQSLLAHTGLVVARRSKGRAMVSLALVKYVDCDLDTYDEIGLAFVVDDPPGAPPLPRGGVATYLHRLPVSESFTCHAGRGIWGFPKWVAPMSISFERSSVVASLDGEVGIRIRAGRIPVPPRPLTMACYSNTEDGSILRTEWTTNNRATRLRLGKRSAEVTLLGSGPLAADLRSLGLPASPVLSMVAGQMRATFAAPACIKPG